MRKIMLFLAMALAVVSCHQKATSTTVAAIPDLLTDRLKGQVTQVETDTYPVDSMGKKGAMDEKSITVYDANGYGKSYTKKSGKDSLMTETAYTVNGNGFLTKQETVEGRGKKKSSLVLEVDSAGKYSLALHYDTTGKIDIYYKNITQNKYMQVTGAKAYHAKDSTIKLAFTNDYDSIYWVGGTSTDSVDKPTYTGKLKLNDKRYDSALNETTVEKGISKITNVTYTYDKWDAQGNWTQQTTVNEKGKPSKITVRVISYKP